MIRPIYLFWERSQQEPYECLQTFSFHYHQRASILNFNPQPFDYKADAESGSIDGCPDSKQQNCYNSLFPFLCPNLPFTRIPMAFFLMFRVEMSFEYHFGYHPVLISDTKQLFEIGWTLKNPPLKYRSLLCH